jgi:hypothetical protein
MQASTLEGLGLAALILLGGCAAPSAPAPGPPTARPTSTPAAPTAIEALRRVDQGNVAAPIHGRDPFGFAALSASRPGARAFPPLPPPDGLPELPLPLPRPAVRLLGIVTGRETPPVRIAVLSAGADLILARVGDVVAARYTVQAISDDNVELVDPAAQEHLRLPLK